MRFSTILLVTALVSVTYISLEQNKTIIANTVVIREMMDNPTCRIAPVWQGKIPHKHGDMYVTPMPPHHPYIVSEN